MKITVITIISTSQHSNSHKDHCDHTSRKLGSHLHQDHYRDHCEQTHIDITVVQFTTLKKMWFSISAPLSNFSLCFFLHPIFSLHSSSSSPNCVCICVHLLSARSRVMSRIIAACISPPHPFHRPTPTCLLFHRPTPCPTVAGGGDLLAASCRPQHSTRSCQVSGHLWVILNVYREKLLFADHRVGLRNGGLRHVHHLAVCQHQVLESGCCELTKYPTYLPGYIAGIPIIHWL